MEIKRKISLFVQEKDHKKRLDVFLSESLKDISRSHIQRLIKSKHVSINGVARKNSFRVSEGEKIDIRFPDLPLQELQPEERPLDIIYEDEDLILVNKPSGLVVHPGSGVSKGTMIHALLAHVTHLSPYGRPYRPGVVHRLDKETSGLIVFAKTSRSHLRIAEQFKNRKVMKKYMALVWGRLKDAEGLIDVPLGRDIKNWKKFSTRTKKAKEAKTSYKVMEYLPGFSLLELQPLTGRTHQLRVHLKFIHHPIVGDVKYGGALWKRIEDEQKREALKSFGRLALHASFLSFLHPSTSERMSFHSPLPEAFERLISLLRSASHGEKRV